MRSHFPRPTLLVAAVAAVLAGCGGGGGSHSSDSGATITAQPSSTTVAAGGTATFSVTATGSNLTYQWYRSGAALSGATSASYTTTTLTSSDNGATFYVVVTGASGSSAKSTTVTLTVGAVGSPSITTQPSAVTAPVGGTASFAVIATGDNLTYQWYKDAVAISGATSPSFTVSPVASTSAGTYYVVITNAVGSVTSSKVALTIGVASKPTITTQPTSQTKAAGATATFAVAASGSGTLTYQWYRGDAAITGATSATYSFTTDSNSSGDYHVVVTNDIGSTTSSTATLTIVTAPVITSQPTSQTVFVNQSVTFTVGATGSNLTYQWYRNGVAVASTTIPSYTFTATANNAGSYKVIVTNVAGSVSSTTVTLTVNGPPTINTQPSSTTVGLGSTATFTVAATGSGSLTYQWYKSGTAIAGATGASYTTPATTSNDNASTYYVVVTNTGGSVTSTTATLTVDQAPTITSQPSSVTVTHPATATFSVTATASGTLTYQWYSSTGGLISGATSASYTTPVTTTAMSGTQYYVKVYNDGVISTTSSSATLTVN